MTAAVEPDAEPAAEPPLVWQVTKREGTRGADITLGEQFADLDGRELTFVTRTIGEGLIKLGTHLMQSRVDSDDYDEDGDDW